MKKNAKKQVSKVSKAKLAAIGGGVAALSAGVAGAYYLLGPNAKAHQKKAKVLLGKIEREVKNKVKKVKRMTAPMYHEAVDVVSKNYTKQYKAHEKDITALARKLKSEWKEIAKKTAVKVTQKAKKKVKKTQKKAK